MPWQTLQANVLLLFKVFHVTWLLTRVCVQRAISLVSYESYRSLKRWQNHFVLRVIAWDTGDLLRLRLTSEWRGSAARAQQPHDTLLPWWSITQARCSCLSYMPPLIPPFHVPSFSLSHSLSLFFSLSLSLSLCQCRTDAVFFFDGDRWNPDNISVLTCCHGFSFVNKQVGVYNKVKTNSVQQEKGKQEEEGGGGNERNIKKTHKNSRQEMQSPCRYCTRFTQ